ncbi:hypothetical protein DCMF_13380 [Candidatus Formimonas warabiya]|uniref:Uncharacterized protein n=1 Tax=Formimonas warabiya TaxID=1761012 RepID=A0A3G1KT41_FORW1|nr:hypothetical protein DCMF_13380 [Candidatus Formimonas warabiya]
MNRKSILDRCLAYISHENLSKLDYIFEYDKVGIAKQFIKDTMELDPEIQPFEDIKKNVCYIVSHMRIEFPDNEAEFYNTVFNRLLFLEGLPRNEYEILNNKVQGLYQKINNIKAQIQAKETQINTKEHENERLFEALERKINKLRNKCQSFKNELQQKETIAVEIFPKLDYEGRKCRHYKQLLDVELIEIQSIDLKKKALSICSRIASDDNNYKYYISSLEDSEAVFLPDCDYSISVKFAKEMNEFIGKFDKFTFDEEAFKKASAEYPYHSNIIETLRNNSIVAYKDFLARYIQEKNICDYIIKNVKNNHVINKRLDVLKGALENYISKQYLSFVNVAAIQIEGIFYDYCFEMDIQPKKLNSFTINTKLDRLHDKQVFNAYEYFAFDFPLIRNKVAHGLLTNGEDIIEIEKIAHETLLDLQYLVYIFQTNKKFPYSSPLEFIESYKNSNRNGYSFHARINNTDPKDECLYSHIKSYRNNITPHDPLNNLQWILNPMYDEVYYFYEISKEHEETRNRLLSCDFIQFIGDKMNKHLTPIGLTSHDEGIVEELETWVQLFQPIICYCKDNNISEEVCKKVISLKELTENNIKCYKQRGYSTRK